MTRELCYEIVASISLFLNSHLDFPDPHLQFACAIPDFLLPIPHSSSFCDCKQLRCWIHTYYGVLISIYIALDSGGISVFSGGEALWSRCRRIFNSHRDSF